MTLAVRYTQNSIEKCFKWYLETLTYCFLRLDGSARVSKIKWLLIYAKTTFLNFYLENYLSNNKISNKKKMHLDAKSNRIFFILKFYWLSGNYCPVQASRPLILSGYWILVSNTNAVSFNLISEGYIKYCCIHSRNDLRSTTWTRIFLMFFTYSAHQTTYENHLKTRLELKMKFDLKIEIFKVQGVCGNFFTTFSYSAREIT